MARKTIQTDNAGDSKPSKKRTGGGIPKKRRSRRAAKKPALGTIDVRRVKFREINPAAYNPRVRLRPGDPEYDKLKRSMVKYGSVDPLIWNERTGNLVGGHQRLTIMQDHGVTEADVSVVNLPLAEEKALNLALNKVSGRWDDELLAELLIELRDDDSIDATLSGFDEDELDEAVKAIDQEIAGEGGGGVAGSQRSAKEAKISATYQVIVRCDNEAEQQKAYDLLSEHGFKAKVTTVY